MLGCCKPNTKECWWPVQVRTDKKQVFPESSEGTWLCPHFRLPLNCEWEWTPCSEPLSYGVLFGCSTAALQLTQKIRSSSRDHVALPLPLLTSAPISTRSLVIPLGHTGLWAPPPEHRSPPHPRASPFTGCFFANTVPFAERILLPIIHTEPNRHFAFDP